MKKELLKKIIFCVTLSLIIIGAVIIIKNKNTKFKDIIKYEGNNYVLLEYNLDVFTYNFNNNANNYYEDDIIYPVQHNKWNVIYFNGDIFILDKQVELATKYYSNDKNYKWFITYEENDNVIKIPVSISSKELDYIYNIENVKHRELTTFEQIDKFVDIVKISDDNFIEALINIVQCDDFWYWKTEIMNENDEEYIVPLPQSLNKKIFNLLVEK